MLTCTLAMMMMVVGSRMRTLFIFVLLVSPLRSCSSSSMILRLLHRCPPPCSRSSFEPAIGRASFAGEGFAAKRKEKLVSRKKKSVPPEISSPGSIRLFLAVPGSPDRNAPRGNENSRVERPIDALRSVRFQLDESSSISDSRSVRTRRRALG